jgi:hypothetical protein
MSDFSIRPTLTTPTQTTQVDNKPLTTLSKTGQTSLQAMGNSVAIQQTIQSQVLSQVFIPAPTLEQLEGLTDISDLNDAEMKLLLQEVEKKTGSEGLQSTLKFDPSAWEKHVGVLVAAIIAVNISRQTSAELKGTYAVMAADAAKAQGMAIIEAGRAVMNSAITGAAVAGAMAMGGMALSLKGQKQKHTDITTNKRDAMDARNRANDLQSDLTKRSFVDNPVDATKSFTVIDKNGKTREVKLDPSAHNLTPQERAILSDEIATLNKKATASELQSAMNEKVYARNLTVGQALTSMAMVLSTMISAVVRLEEYAQRQNEVQQQSVQTLGRSMTDEQAQRLSEESSLMQKLLEVAMQIMQGRNAAASTIASAVKA